MVRLSRAEKEMLDGLARQANIGLGGLLRECAIRSAATVAREVQRGDMRMRRAKAVEAVRGQVQPASSLVTGPSDYAEIMRARQLRVNADRDKPKAKAKR